MPPSMGSSMVCITTHTLARMMRPCARLTRCCTGYVKIIEAVKLAAARLRGETPELGIWYDAESTRMTTGDVTETCMAFLNRLTDYGHQYQGIYASWNWLSKDGAHYIDVDALPDYVPIWVAQYSKHDDLSDEYPGRVRIWQYSDCFGDDLPYDADIYYDA